MGPFVLVPPAASWLEGSVRDLRVDPAGTAWLVTERGVGYWQDGAWTLLREEPGCLAGFDDSGRVWWIPEERAEILSWDGTGWTAYGPEAGWTPLQTPDWRPPSGRPSVVTDRRGWVWLADRGAVYTFDGQSWTVHSLDQVGFTVDPQDEYGWFYLTKAARDGEGDIWVGSCEILGESTGGQGARWFDGDRWGGADSPVTRAGCVYDIELDAQGRLWLGVGNNLSRYTPSQGWQHYAPPEFDPAWGNFWGDILAIAIDPQGEPWAFFDVCGGASCGDIQQLFHLQGERWVWAGGCTLECRWDTSVAFAPDGSAWFCADYPPSDDPNTLRSGVYHVVVGGAPELVGTLGGGCEVLAVDGAGRIWLVPSHGLSSVYVYENP